MHFFIIVIFIFIHISTLASKHTIYLTSTDSQDLFPDNNLGNSINKSYYFR